jgi:hypothetical protein
MLGFGTIPWINDKDHAEDYLKENNPEMYKFRQ